MGWGLAGPVRGAQSGWLPVGVVPAGLLAMRRELCVMDVRRVGRRHRLVVGLVLVVLAAGCAPPSGPVGEGVNPELVGRCGLDVSVLLDRSGSVSSALSDVRLAAQNLADGLAGSVAPNRLSVVSFASSATAHPAPSFGPSPELSDVMWSDADDVVMPELTGGGSTNIEDGVEMFRRRTDGFGDFLVIYTDGMPNEHNLLFGSGSMPGNGHGSMNVNFGEHFKETIREVNALKSAGVRVFAVGTGSTDVAFLKKLAGPVEYEPTVNDPATADWAYLESSADLPALFTAIAEALCPDGDPGPTTTTTTTTTTSTTTPPVPTGRACIRISAWKQLPLMNSFYGPPTSPDLNVLPPSVEPYRDVWLLTGSALTAINPYFDESGYFGDEGFVGLSRMFPGFPATYTEPGSEPFNHYAVTMDGLSSIFVTGRLCGDAPVEDGTYRVQIMSYAYSNGTSGSLWAPYFEPPAPTLSCINVSTGDVVYEEVGTLSLSGYWGIAVHSIRMPASATDVHCGVSPYDPATEPLYLNGTVLP